MIVAGWDQGPRFAHILPTQEAVYDSPQSLSLHAFHVALDPAAAGLCEQRVALSGIDGPTLPIKAAQRLGVDTQGELTWDPLDLDPTQGPTFPNLAFDNCSSIPGCVGGGECRAGCTPSEVVAPRPPRGGCPAGWRDVGDAEMEFCFPELWIVNNRATRVAPQDCPGTQHDLDGTCVTLGPCALGEFAEPPSDAQEVVYIASSAPAAGDGSQTRPFRELAEALNSAPSADVIMLAAGRYVLPPSFQLGPRRLIGVCADEVSLEAEQLTVTDNASISGVRVIGERTAVQVLGGNLALTGVSIESPGRAVVVNNGTLTSTKSRLLRIASPDSPDLSALSILSSTVALHSTSIEGIFSAENANVSLSHFSVVSTDTYNATFHANGSTVVLTRGRLLNEGQQFAFFSTDSKRVLTTDLYASSMASGTIFLRGAGSDYRFIRLAIASRDSTAAAFQVEQAEVELTDYALFAGGSAMEVRGSAGLTPRIARAVVKRAWVNVGGRVGFWTTDSGGGIDLEDLWMDALPSQSVATDEFVSCFLQRGDQGSVRRARIRPRGRHGLVVSDSGQVEIEDVELLEQHGRSMWIVPGSQVSVRRLRAVGSAGFDGSKFGLPGVRSEMVDIDLEVSVGALEALGGAFFVQGQPEADIDRFRVRGPLTVDPGLNDGSLVMVDGTMDAPATQWPQTFSDHLSQVRLLLPPLENSRGCEP